MFGWKDYQQSSISITRARSFAQSRRLSALSVNTPYRSSHTLPGNLFSCRWPKTPTKRVRQMPVCNMGVHLSPQVQGVRQRPAFSDTIVTPLRAPSKNPMRKAARSPSLSVSHVLHPNSKKVAFRPTFKDVTACPPLPMSRQRQFWPPGLSRTNASLNPISLSPVAECVVGEYPAITPLSFSAPKHILHPNPDLPSTRS